MDMKGRGGCKGRWDGREDLRGVEGGETIIRIYYLRKKFILKNKINKIILLVIIATKAPISNVIYPSVVRFTFIGRVKILYKRIQMHSLTSIPHLGLPL